jgi:hypothetical protein
LSGCVQIQLCPLARDQDQDLIPLATGWKFESFLSRSFRIVPGHLAQCGTDDLIARLRGGQPLCPGQGVFGIRACQLIRNVRHQIESRTS